MAKTTPEQLDMMAEHKEHIEVQAEKKRVNMILAIINHALDVLAARSLLFLALGCSAALFGWSALEPDILRLVGAAIFTALTFLPALFKRERNG